ncbi:MAG: phosphoribosylglycinamide synthetase C domain-containing protein, partial [Actinomycetota bacterium]
AVSVVLAAEGYPSAPVFGAVISGLDSRGQLAQEREGVTVFHAGTTRNADGDFVTSGGRVLTVTAQGPSVAAARQAAYAAAATVSFEGMVQRSDIAQNYSKESA